MTGIALGNGNVHYQVKPVILRVSFLHEVSFAPKSTSWLVQHQPVISWRTGDVLQWDQMLFPCLFPSTRSLPRQLAVIPVNHISTESPITQQSVDILASFADVFSPKWASKLPTHCPWHCAIDLLSQSPHSPSQNRRRWRSIYRSVYMLGLMNVVIADRCWWSILWWISLEQRSDCGAWWIRDNVIQIHTFSKCSFFPF